MNASAIRWSQVISPLPDGTSFAIDSRRRFASANDSGGSWTVMVRTSSLQRSERRSWSAAGSDAQRGAAPSARQHGELAHRTNTGLFEQAGFALGRGDVGEGAQLVKADLAGLERTDQLRDVPCLLRDVDEGPGAGLRELESFRAPVGGGGRAVVPVGLTPVRFSQELDDVAIERGPQAEEIVETDAELRIGHRRDRRIRWSPAAPGRPRGACLTPRHRTGER